MSVKMTTVYRGPGYPVDPARESERYTWPGMDWIVPPRPDPIIASMCAALERYEQETRISRTIRRVETIVNFKDEFGRGDRPDWGEFVSPARIWRRYARQDKSK